MVAGHSFFFEGILGPFGGILGILEAIFEVILGTFWGEFRAILG